MGLQIKAISPKISIEFIESMKREIEQDFEWDKRKIAIGLAILAVLTIGAVELKDYFTGASNSVLGKSSISESSEIEKPNIKTPDLDIQSEVGPRIEEIKKNINKLDAAEIASSSSQIQKVLNDIQGIRDLPSSQAKEMCLKICSGI